MPISQTLIVHYTYQQYLYKLDPNRRPCSTFYYVCIYIYYIPIKLLLSEKKFKLPTSPSEKSEG